MSTNNNTFSIENLIQIEGWTLVALKTDGYYTVPNLTASDFGRIKDYLNEYQYVWGEQEPDIYVRAVFNNGFFLSLGRANGTGYEKIMIYLQGSNVQFTWHRLSF